MSRREKLENIIIGTLLESTEDDNYFTDCRSCITEDMFSDEVNKRIFRMVAEMNAKGIHDTTPFDILKEYGNAVMDICADMAEKVCEFSFIHLKMQYNEIRFLEGCILETYYKRTDIRFIDYVKTFIKLAYS